jgi:hypothetical protein
MMVNSKADSILAIDKLSVTLEPAASRSCLGLRTSAYRSSNLNGGKIAEEPVE